jgi:hypothetical protein
MHRQSLVNGSRVGLWGGLLASAFLLVLIQAPVALASAEVVLPAGAGTNPKVFLNALVCPSSGNCQIAGDYTDSSNNQQGLLVSESSGTWAAGATAPLPANSATSPNIHVTVDDMACTSAGNCVAVGSYDDNAPSQQGLLLTETSGSWSAAEAPLPTGAAADPRASLNSVTCPSAGNCIAVGSYKDATAGGEGLLLNLSSGTWTATGAPLPASPAPRGGGFDSVAIPSVSCDSADDYCVAGGMYENSTGNFTPLLLINSTGTSSTSWTASAPALPGDANNTSSELTAFQCFSSTNCNGVGFYGTTTSNIEGLLLDESSGTWTQTVAGLPAGAKTSGQFVAPGTLSCTSAGNCTTAASYVDGSGNQQGLLLTESAGTWATGTEASLPANAGSNPFAALTSVACPSAGNCTAVGAYDDNSFNSHALVVSQSSGTWGAGVESSAPANAGTNPNDGFSATCWLIGGDCASPSVACASAGNCTAIGFYNNDASDQFGLITAAPPAQAALAASAPATGTAGTAIAASSLTGTLSSGTSPTGTITFKVFGPQSSAPTDCSAGTIVGTASPSDNGSYHPSAGFTPSSAGNYWWYASYDGDVGNNSAASACGGGMAETVESKATPSLGLTGPSTGTVGTALTASSVTASLSSGASPGGTITFKVFGPQSSAPTSCSSGGTTVGTASASGNGSYHPSAGFSPAGAGDYWWYASYGGDSGNTAATSTCGSGMAETAVAKASPSLSLSAPSTGKSGFAISASSVTGTLAAGSSPSGTITFAVFGPQSSAPTSCASGGTTVGTATASGGGTYHPSASFKPTRPGDYWWYASYGGDSGNNTAASACGGAMAETVVAAAVGTPHVGKVKASGTVATVSIHCSGAACRVKLELTAKGATLGKAKSTVGAGATKKVKVGLNAKGKHLLAKDKKLKVTLTVTGSGKTVKKTVTFRR